MTSIIENYLNNLTIEKTNEIALQNGIKLSLDELNFVYSYIRSNAKEVLINKNSFNFDQYRNKFSPTNYLKIKDLIDKYANYL